MKIILCAKCGCGISPFIQTWKEFLTETEGWKKYYCIGEKQHDLNVCPKCKIEKCTICNEQVLDETEWNRLSAESYDCTVGSRF